MERLHGTTLDVMSAMPFTLALHPATWSIHNISFWHCCRPLTCLISSASLPQHEILIPLSDAPLLASAINFE